MLATPHTRLTSSRTTVATSSLLARPRIPNKRFVFSTNFGAFFRSTRSTRP